MIIIPYAKCNLGTFIFSLINKCLEIYMNKQNLLPTFIYRMNTLTTLTIFLRFFLAWFFLR